VRDERVDVVVFAGPAGPSVYERLMGRGLAALAGDLVETALACPLVGRVVVATGSAEVATALGGVEGVVVEPDAEGTPFHFGRRLLEVVERHGIRRPLYFGAGSAPLMGPGSFEALCRRLLGAERTVIANNLLSADFFGFSPPEALRRVALPPGEDNNLPFLLTRQGGLRAEPLEPSVETEFDVDTPTDLAVLRLQGAVKARARRFLDGAGLDTSRLEAVMPVLVRRRSEVTLIGRVSTNVWGKVPSDLIPGQKRLYVEERGMKASGREARGRVRSLVGSLLEAVGPERLFEVLAGFSDAVFFDSRVVFQHLRLGLSAADRFASDLGEVEGIADPAARAFTAAAVGARVPVVLGGRNVVAGGLWALTQAAWDRADAGLIVPESDRVDP
jgi:hypothetical protein